MAAFAVATLVFALVTLWRSATRPQVAQMVLRGHGGDLPLVGTRTPDGTLHLVWPQTPRTVAYRVEIADSRGHALSRSVAQPSLDLTVAELPLSRALTVTVESALASGDRTSRATTLRIPRPDSAAP